MFSGCGKGVNTESCDFVLLCSRPPSHAKSTSPSPLFDTSCLSSSSSSIFLLSITAHWVKLAHSVHRICTPRHHATGLITPHTVPHLGSTVFGFSVVSVYVCVPLFSKAYLRRIANWLSSVAGFTSASGGEPSFRKPAFKASSSGRISYALVLSPPRISSGQFIG